MSKLYIVLFYASGDSNIQEFETAKTGGVSFQFVELEKAKVVRLYIAKNEKDARIAQQEFHKDG